MIDISCSDSLTTTLEHLMFLKKAEELDQLSVIEFDIEEIFKCDKFELYEEHREIIVEALNRELLYSTASDYLFDIPDNIMELSNDNEMEICFTFCYTPLLDFQKKVALAYTMKILTKEEHDEVMDLCQEYKKRTYNLCDRTDYAMIDINEVGVWVLESKETQEEAQEVLNEWEDEGFYYEEDELVTISINPGYHTEDNMIAMLSNGVLPTIIEVQAELRSWEKVIEFILEEEKEREYLNVA